MICSAGSGFWGRLSAFAMLESELQSSMMMAGIAKTIRKVSPAISTALDVTSDRRRKAPGAGLVSSFLTDSFAACFHVLAEALHGVATGKSDEADERQQKRFGNKPHNALLM
jgi:hypothetical protein